MSCRCVFGTPFSTLAMDFTVISGQFKCYATTISNSYPDSNTVYTYNKVSIGMIRPQTRSEMNSMKKFRLSSSGEETGDLHRLTI